MYYIRLSRIRTAASKPDHQPTIELLSSALANITRNGQFSLFRALVSFRSKKSRIVRHRDRTHNVKLRDKRGFLVT